MVITPDVLSKNINPYFLDRENADTVTDTKLLLHSSVFFISHPACHFYSEAYVLSEPWYINQLSEGKFSLRLFFCLIFQALLNLSYFTYSCCRLELRILGLKLANCWIDRIHIRSSSDLCSSMKSKGIQ